MWEPGSKHYQPCPSARLIDGVNPTGLHYYLCVKSTAFLPKSQTEADTSVSNYPAHSALLDQNWNLHYLFSYISLYIFSIVTDNLKDVLSVVLLCVLIQTLGKKLYSFYFSLFPPLVSV